jgi:Coenzyme PQQ synthesis protein D (PqqD)
MRDDDLFQLREGLVAREFENETVILDLRTSSYLTSNRVGRLIWRELERGTTCSQIVTAVVDTFEVDRERAAADVDVFLDECRRRGFLKAEAPPTSDERRV